jgi:hypothetical protein
MSQLGLGCFKTFPTSRAKVGLSPSEAWQCSWQAGDWRIVGGNLRRMWANFAGTTIGEWDEIIFAFALVPAQLASYVWPFMLIGLVTA